MKRTSMLLVAVFVFALSALPAIAEDMNEMMTVRRSILVPGEFQRYMPFPFTVTSVGCGNPETFEMKMSNSFFGQKGSWEKKYIGEKAPRGLYRFNVTDADLSKCAPVMDISGEIPKWALNGNYIGSFMEVEPEDLGLLVKGKSVPENVFNLSTDDRKFSYELVVMSSGTERTVESFINNTHFFSDTGTGIVGAVIADNRGFLKKVVMFNLDPKPARTISVPVVHRAAWGRSRVSYRTINIPAETAVSPEDNIIVREGDVFVLIRAENL